MRERLNEWLNMLLGLEILAKLSDDVQTNTGHEVLKVARNQIPDNEERLIFRRDSLPGSTMGVWRNWQTR